MNKKKPVKPLPPIGEEMQIARDMLWNPRMEPTKTPLSDIAMPNLPPDHEWGKTKPRGKSLTAIVAIVEEMKAAYGDCPATKAFERKLLEEAGLVEIPHDRKSFDDAMGELNEE